MKLQIALDTVSSDQAVELVGRIADVIDIVEIGTPMVVREGMTGVRKVKEKYPKVTVLADTKIVDGGDLECADACEAGADIVTVLALADNATVQAVIETAHKYGRKAMADLICVTDIPRRAKELFGMGMDYICVHTAVDVQRSGKTPLDDLKELVSAIPPERAAVAGGISLSSLDKYVALKPDIVIAGSSLLKAPDMRAAVVEMKEKMGR
jgi:3-hexulose-6-phosphate synthase